MKKSISLRGAGEVPKRNRGCLFPDGSAEPEAEKLLSEILHNKEEIKVLIDSESTGATMTIGIANAAAKLGFKTEFFSACLGFNPKLFELEYYQKVTDGARKVEEKINRLRQECAKNGVIMREKSLTREEIQKKINKDCVAFILLDWGKIIGKSYIGHFVPIVGFDDKHVYIHQPGPKDPTPNQPLSREMFEAARKARGTDEDIVFIHRKEITS